MIIEIAVLLITIVFAALAGYTIATLMQVRKAVNESRVLLVRLNEELPSLLKELRTMAEKVNALAAEARDGIEHASVLLHAVGEVGETVQQVHGLVRGQTGSVVAKLASMLAGIRAASAVVKDRLRRGSDLKEGGESNGGL